MGLNASQCGVFAVWFCVEMFDLFVVSFRVLSLRFVVFVRRRCFRCIYFQVSKFVMFDACLFYNKSSR